MQADFSLACVLLLSSTPAAMVKGTTLCFTSRTTPKASVFASVISLRMSDFASSNRRVINPMIEAESLLVSMVEAAMT